MTGDGLTRFPVTYEGLPQEQPFLIDTTGDSLANDIVLPATPVELKLTVTSAQFTDLLSAALNGAERYFGDRYIDVIYPLIKAAKEYCSMPCDDVADCIETSESVQDALINQVNTNLALQEALRKLTAETLLQMGFDPDATTVPSSVSSTEIKSLENCDKDKLWAGIREGIVQRLDDNARQFYEIMVTKVDLLERANSVIAAIPVVGSLASSLVNQFIQIIPDLKNAYEAYSSIEALDNAACEIFGLVCELCRYPTYEELYDYFASFGQTGIQDLTTLTSTIAYETLVGSGVGTGFIVWHTSIAVQIYTLMLNEKFGDLLGIASIEEIASLGEDFESDNWEVLCDSCVAQYEVWSHEFSQGQGDFQIVSVSGVPQATYESGVMDSVPSGSNRTIQITLPLSADWRIVGARITYEVENQNQTIMRWREYAGSNTNAVNPSISNCTEIVTGYRQSWQGVGIVPPSSPVTGKREMLIVLGATGLTSTLRIHRVEIEFEFGFGKSPSQATPDEDALWC